MDIEIKKDLASNWFKLLQNAICDDISRLEKNKIKFKSTSWQRSKIKDEGGGEYRIITNGKVFEKVGVNFSKVYGQFPKKFQKNIPGASNDPRFWASGISIVIHMQNPHIPAMHFKHGKARNPWPNVDAASGSLLHHYGIKEFQFYTVLFSMSRSLGIVSQMVLARAMGMPLTRPKSLTYEALKQL